METMTEKLRYQGVEKIRLLTSLRSWMSLVVYIIVRDQIITGMGELTSSKRLPYATMRACERCGSGYKAGPTSWPKLRLHLGVFLRHSVQRIIVLRPEVHGKHERNSREYAINSAALIPCERVYAGRYTRTDLPPASRSNTRMFSFSDRRDASTQPEVPTSRMSGHGVWEK